MHAKYIGTFALFAALSWLSPATVAQDNEDAEEDLERCIQTIRIQHTYVIDDYRILFYMRGRDVYLNQLPRRCGGLGFEGRFSYRSTAGRLCHLDSITVLRGGVTMNQGATCGLGKFLPITEEEADDLRNAEPTRPEAEELPTAEPEDIGEPG